MKKPISSKEELDKVMFDIERINENPHYIKYMQEVKPAFQIGSVLEQRRTTLIKYAEKLMKEIERHKEIQKGQELGARGYAEPVQQQERVPVAPPTQQKPQPQQQEPTPEEQMQQDLGYDESELAKELGLEDEEGQTQ